MPRVKRGTVRRAKRKKLLGLAKGYYANKSKLYRAAKESVDTALKLHADELEGSGGAELAAELGALSADHLAGVSDAGVRALAASGTVAVLLPATMVFLGKKGQAPARRLVEAGAAVALATDFNPGTSPTVLRPPA